MSRWLIRLAFPALAVLVGLMVYGVKAPEGATSSAVKPAQTDTIPSFEAVVPVPVTPEGPDIVFKWQEEDGSWHYADQPPSQGSWYTLAIDPAPGARQGAPGTPARTDGDLTSPYSAPFALDSQYPRNGS